MKSLHTTGLSLSQATSISNLINQKALDIKADLDSINNYSKCIDINGKEHNTVNPKPISDDIIGKVIELGRIHATQAFLMENIKAKTALISKIKTQKFETDLVEPIRPTTDSFKPLKEVDEVWGFEQLTESEYNEYLDATSIASHIGQFIHRGSVLDKLRKELPTIPAIEFFELKKDEKTPVTIKVHHTPGQLLSIHNELAKQHRDAEMRVNYFKAKVKNLVTIENGRIAQSNADGQNSVNSNNQTILNQWNDLYREYTDRLLVQRQEFEVKRNEEIKKASALRIKIDPRFQETINLFLEKDKEGEEH